MAVLRPPFNIPISAVFRTLDEVMAGLFVFYSPKISGAYRVCSRRFCDSGKLMDSFPDQLNWSPIKPASKETSRFWSRNGEA